MLWPKLWQRPSRKSVRDNDADESLQSDNLGKSSSHASSRRRGSSLGRRVKRTFSSGPRSRAPKPETTGGSRGREPLKRSSSFGGRIKRSLSSSSLNRLRRNSTVENKSSVGDPKEKFKKFQPRRNQPQRRYSNLVQEEEEKARREAVERSKKEAAEARKKAAPRRKSATAEELEEAARKEAVERSRVEAMAARAAKRRQSFERRS